MLSKLEKLIRFGLNQKESKFTYKEDAVISSFFLHIHVDVTVLVFYRKVKCVSLITTSSF